MVRGIEPGIMGAGFNVGTGAGQLKKKKNSVFLGVDIYAEAVILLDSKQGFRQSLWQAAICCGSGVGEAFIW